MENYELAKYANVDVDQLPAIINDQFKALNKVKQNVGRVTQEADTALESAKSAANKGTGPFQRKEAIESLQGAAVDLANAQVAAAEAQEVSFEYQQSLAEMSKFLFRLGVSNIKANRYVVRELELRLKGASQEQLDDLARKEIAEVIQQLKDQEDIMKKQQDLTTKVKGHDTRIGGLEDQIDDQDKKLKERISKDEEHDKRLDDQNKKLEERISKDEEHDKRFDNQDKKLEERISKDEEHDKILKEYSELFEKQKESIKSLFEEVNVLKVKVNAFSICAIVALIIGIAHFFI